MNYKHIYHAGNFADVIKHVLWITLIQELQKKEKPISLIDTHAGAGFYDLTLKESQINKEYQTGIDNLMSHKTSLQAVKTLQALYRKLNTNSRMHYYPGSPLVAQNLLRNQDRMILIEKHPEIYQQLKYNMGKDSRITFHQRDGYEAINALLPPTPRRGAVLIDPPFEEKNELALLVEAIKKANQRWESAAYAIWYPLKVDSSLQSFYQGLKKVGCKQTLKTWIQVKSETSTGLIGSGMIFLNPPWQFEMRLEETVAFLATTLSQLDQPCFEIKTL